MVKSRLPLYFILLLAGLFTVGCPRLNDPHPQSEVGKNYYYSSFSGDPKHLDPASSYASNEYEFLGLVYEPPFQFHYLKRPYTLVPLTATKVPKPEYFDKAGKSLGSVAAEKDVAKVVYTFHLKPGIMYQEHPCFAKDARGKYLYHNLTDEDVRGYQGVTDFPQTGTRELIAADYVYQIKRLALPALECPILPIMGVYIIGLKELHLALRKERDAERKRRSAAGGLGYNQERDELDNPLRLDLEGRSIAGAKVLGRYTYQLTLKKKYPQMLLWMTLPFFAPMPPEADRFYEQAAMLKKSFTLQRWPVGTGPYRFETYRSNRRIVLTRNTHYTHGTYPTEGEAGDQAAGLLVDAGKPLPFIDKLVWAYEKQTTPRWNKFLQGYYDVSGIPEDNFDGAINFAGGQAGITGSLKKKGISLDISVSPSLYYYGFNMLDPVVGGYTEKKRQLRQAISIAIDIEEYIQVYKNGRGLPGMGLLPPGIPGYRPGNTRAGMNPYVYNWDAVKKRPVRKDISEAKKLLAEAGYPDGIGKEGPLVLFYDSYRTDAGAAGYFKWLSKQFAKLNIHLEIRSTDYSQFQEKMSSGTEQIFSWGWNADYPDPENFLFLLYGPHRKARAKKGEGGGSNAANYSNPEYDRLFLKMKAMDNSPARQKIIDEMVEIVRHDAPWCFNYLRTSFGLRHHWVKNSKPLEIGNNKLKYIRLDVAERTRQRAAWNKPNWQPVICLGLFLLTVTGLTMFLAQRRSKRGC